MSSETIVTAIFLITAVVAAGILTSVIFPAVSTMSSTVSSSAHSADQSMRETFPPWAVTASVSLWNLSGDG